MIHRRTRRLLSRRLWPGGKGPWSLTMLTGISMDSMRRLRMNITVMGCRLGRLFTITSFKPLRTFFRTMMKRPRPARLFHQVVDSVVWLSLSSSVASWSPLTTSTATAMASKPWESLLLTPLALPSVDGSSMEE